MILIIALKEWRVLWRRPVLVRWLAVLSVLYLASLVVGLVEMRRATARAAEVQNQFVEQWLNQGPRLPHAAAHFGLPWVASPPLMTAIEPGVWPYLGEFTQAGAHDMVSFRSPAMSAGGSLKSLYTVSPVWVLQYLLPLWVVLVSYRLSLEERLLGTERALKALGVHPLVQVLGCGLGVCAALFAVVAGLLFATLVAVAPFGGLTSDTVMILLLQGLVAFLSSGVLIWICLSIPLLIRQPRPVAGLALSAWFGLTVLAPAWVNDRARLERIGPSEIELSRVLTQDMERGAYEFGGRRERGETTLQTLLTSLGKGRKEDLPVNFPLFFLMAEDETFNIFVDRRLDAAMQAYRAQDAWRRRWVSASPFAAWQVLSPVLSGTGLVDRIKLTNGLEVHRRRFIRILNRQQTAMLLRQQDPVGDKALWNSVTPFRADSPTPLADVAGYQREFFILTVWFLGAAMIAVGGAVYIAVREAA